MTEIRTDDAPHRVSGRFRTSDAMQKAVSALTMEGFDRASLSLSPAALGDGPIPETASGPVFTDEDARQARTLHASGAATVAALAGAGIVVATGGIAAVAAVAAVAAGAAAGGGAFALSTAANDSEQTDRDDKADSGRLVLAVQAPTPELRGKAERILRQSGAEDILAA